MIYYKKIKGARCQLVKPRNQWRNGANRNAGERGRGGGWHFTVKRKLDTEREARGKGSRGIEQGKT